MRVLGGVDHHHTVLVEQFGIAFYQDLQVTAIFKVQPSSAIGQHISTCGCANVERWAHTAATLFVATALFVSQCGLTPKAQLCGMRATLVSTRNESRVAAGDFSQSGCDVIPFGTCRVRLGSHHHKVVVHHRKAFDTKAFGHKLFFSRNIVHKDHIRITAASHVQSLACAQGHHFDVNACGFFKLGQEVAKQARLLSGRGG